VIVERSPLLAARQRERLKAIANFFGSTSWFEKCATEFALPESAIVFANELLDCLPFDRVVMIDGALHPLYVTVEKGKWVEVWDTLEEEVAADVDRNLGELAERVEEPVSLAESVRRGAICLVDYGGRGPLGDSLLKREDLPHQKRVAVRMYGDQKINRRWKELIECEGHPLGTLVYESPGQVDLTYSVDFALLERVFQDAGEWTIQYNGPQEDFLLRAGLLEEMLPKTLEKLGRASTSEELCNAASAAQFGQAFLERQMREWFHVFFAVREIEAPLLLYVHVPAASQFDQDIAAVEPVA